MIIEVESAKKEGPFKKVYTPLNNARNGKNGKADNPMFSSNMNSIITIFLCLISSIEK